MVIYRILWHIAIKYEKSQAIKIKGESSTGFNRDARIRSR